MWRHAMWGHTTWLSAMWHHTMWRHTMWHHTMWRHTMWLRAMWHHTMWHHTMWHHTMWRHTMSRRTMWRHTMWHHKMWRHTMWLRAPLTIDECHLIPLVDSALQCLHLSRILLLIFAPLLPVVGGRLVIGRPGVHRLHELPVKNLDEALGGAVIVDAAPVTFAPAEGNQVELAIPRVDEVACVPGEGWKSWRMNLNVEALRVADGKIASTTVRPWWPEDDRWSFEGPMDWPKGKGPFQDFSNI